VQRTRRRARSFRCGNAGQGVVGGLGQSAGQKTNDRSILQTSRHNTTVRP